MTATGRIPDLAMRLGILITILLFASCQSPDEPQIDRTPPTTPDVTLLRASVPGADGMSRISGSAGSVEPESEVTVRQSGLTSPRFAQARAEANGSFEVQLQAEFLELLEVVATDAADNSSRAALLAVGAPFQMSQEGSSTHTATAGDSLQSSIAVIVQDESGAPAAGVTVTFSAVGLSPASLAVETDGAGRALWSRVAPTQTGDFTLTAETSSGLLAEGTSWSLRVLPDSPEALLVVTGSEQIGEPGSVLQDALQVRLVDRFGNGITGFDVAWSVSQGSISAIGNATDSTGTARASWTLPGTEGEYEATASTATSPVFSVQFVGIAGGPPEVHSYSPDPAVPGDLLTIEGVRFSRALEYNEITFPTPLGATLGTLVDASSDRLVVEVPSDAFSGELLVRVCDRQATASDFRVEVAIGRPMEVPVSSDRLRLETPSGNEEFVLALYSDAATTSSFSIGATPVFAAKELAKSELNESGRFHHWLRKREKELRRAPRVQPAIATSKPLEEGSFTVLASLSGSSYEQVTASLRFQGTYTLLYVDNRVLSSELPQQELQALAQKFDKAGGSYAAVKNAFGNVSDINLDHRVVILLTPTVNELTPPGSGAFVGGFFFSQDLHAVANSNRMEILYGMVPDPTGRWGNVFPVSPTIDVLDGVLPHELQHLISYNEHVLQRNSEPEELWLNESLSHLAENLAGVHQQNIQRANLFLRAPAQVSLTQGGNALEERGMGFLFVRYLADQEDAGFTSRLVQTSSTGRSNVEGSSGRFFVDWMADWVATLYLDHTSLSREPHHVFTSLDFSADFEAPHVDALSLQAPSAAGTLPAAGCRLYRLSGTNRLQTDLVVNGSVRAFVIRTR